jgi:ethanolamine utilization protein
VEDFSYEKLVELVTAEVIKAIGKETDDKNDEPADFRPVALVIGSDEKLPNFAVESCQLRTLDDYDGDISGFDRIFIAKLNYSELSDIALGRNNGKTSCAVINGILNGKKIYLLESALDYRQYKSTANRNFYMMLEGYVHKLQSFGIELIKEQWYGKNLEKSAIADNTADKVITEKIAKSLILKNSDVISLRKGTVITPSAKDVFNHSEKKVEFVD